MHQCWFEVDPGTCNSRTMVPVRLVAEALGAQVDWINETQTVVIVQGGITLTLPVGESLPGGMGVPVLLRCKGEVTN